MNDRQTRALDLRVWAACCRGIAGEVRRRRLGPPEAFALLRRLVRAVAGAIELPGEVYAALRDAGALPADWYVLADRLDGWAAEAIGEAEGLER